MKEIPASSFSEDGDTIAAIITPPGEGGIAAIRLAGPRSGIVLKNHFRTAKGDESGNFESFLMRFGHFVDNQGNEIDEILAVLMPKGHSYTGLEQAEIFCHGGSQAAKKILNSLIESGARAAESGEFTKLAFLSGRIDLGKAEAVAEMIGAQTDRSFKVAKEHLLGSYSKVVETIRLKLIELIAEIEASIDFPEEELDPQNQSQLRKTLTSIENKIVQLVSSYQGGRIINEGYKIAICGRPNAGKSSLFNLLLRQERALVTPTPGTTRDYLAEWIDLDGYAVNIIDTAGLRTGGGAIEKAGQSSARKIMSQSDLIIWLVDLSQKNWRKQLHSDLHSEYHKNVLLVGNKSDKLKSKSVLTGKPDELNILPLSCVTKKGMENFKRELLSKISDSMPDLT
ncbi:MAG: tRNA uridine-5-carboxymethylaminomethyl(34) synthesis GTPase MnmE, partial [Candidatus Zixiibacteriota bacterium]